MFTALVRSKKLDLKNLKHFVLDECDKMLAELDMRRDVQVYTNKSGGCFPPGEDKCPLSSLLPQVVKWKQNMISTKIITKETKINEKPYEMKL